MTLSITFKTKKDIQTLLLFTLYYFHIYSLICSIILSLTVYAYTKIWFSIEIFGYSLKFLLATSYCGPIWPAACPFGLPQVHWAIAGPLFDDM